MENAMNMTETLMRLNKLFSDLVGPGRFKFILDDEKKEVFSKQAFKIFTSFSDKKFYWTTKEDWDENKSNAMDFDSWEKAQNYISPDHLLMLGKSVYVERTF